jgi:predicted oxidoreductase
MSGGRAPYLKGKRLEVTAREWLRALDPGCDRAFMSRGVDVTFQWLLRMWSISCKCGKQKSISLGKIKGELEDHDICITHEDRDSFPLVHIYLPKFVEILGRSEGE